MKKTASYLFLAMAIILAGGSTAFSIPVLQIYIEDAVYDTGTETWVYSPVGSSSAGEATIRLWAIGNIAGQGGKGGPISDVKLSIAYDSAIMPEFTLTPKTIDTNIYPGWDDLSIAAEPALIQTNDTGAPPLLGDGSSMPAHGIFRQGVTWQEFSLGDMTLADSPIGDFIGSFPDPISRPNGDGLGQINLYEILIRNVDHGDNLHFDLYDHVEAANHSKFVFAPFSHDADGQTNIVPEPSALLLLGSGICSLAFYTRLRRRKQ
jgi:hypothetical protein